MAANCGLAPETGLHAGRHGRVHRHAKRAAGLVGWPCDGVSLYVDLRVGMGQPVAVNMSSLRRARNQHQQKAKDRREPHPEGMGREEPSGLTLLGHLG